MQSVLYNRGMETLICKTCEKELPATKENFYRHPKTRTGFFSKCKSCFSGQKAREYYQQNRERRIEYAKTYARNNPEKIIKYTRKYFDKNKESIRKRHRERYATDPVYRLRFHISGKIKKGLLGKKKSSVWEKLGYTPSDLKTHLEKQFDDEMSWENCGR